MSYYVGKFLARVQTLGFGPATGSAFSFLYRKMQGNARLKPYEYIQLDVQRNLHNYLRVAESSIRRILIIGAHLGFEVPDMLSRYPLANFMLFEASPRYFKILENKFFKEHRVKVFDCLITDVDREVDFYETNVDGSGSVLELGHLAKASHNLEQMESYKLQSYRLDTHSTKHGYEDEIIDCLWIDVQGAELLVLNGAQSILKNVKSIFLEVSIFEELYVGGAVLGDLSKLLESNHFRMVGLGTDPFNGTGNGFYINIKLNNL